jgi:hypothetical protein
VGYYSLLHWQQDPKGRAERVKLPIRWMPIWQGFLDVAMGELTPPLWVAALLPEGMSPLAQRLLNDWRLALWLRQREYPDAKQSFFDPKCFAICLQARVADVVSAWEELDGLWIVEQAEDGTPYQLGDSPMTPEKAKAMYEGIEDDTETWARERQKNSGQFSGTK